MRRCGKLTILPSLFFLGVIVVFLNIYNLQRSGDRGSQLKWWERETTSTDPPDPLLETTLSNVTRHVKTDYCDEYPSTLVGEIKVQNCPDLKTAESRHPEVHIGGEWSPSDCRPLQTVAVIIPYRDRLTHLVAILNHLHPVLQRQKLHYKIFVVEQLGTQYFNKGALMNTAFLYANETFPMDCVVFHDVDLLPINDRNLYRCMENPRHLSVAIDVFRFKNFYWNLVGGVLNFRRHMFTKVNGYSNLFWGWGAEDDDMWWRLHHNNVTAERANEKIARFVMLKHNSRRKQEKGWTFRYNLSRSQKETDRTKTDGLTSLNTKIERVHEEALYTHLLVDVGVQPTMDINVTPVD